MLFSATQIATLATHGYVIFPCPFDASLTTACQDAVARHLQPEPCDLAGAGVKANHFRLHPQTPESYWCALDHSLPFLRIMLHPEIAELARQLLGEQDLYLRNGGINEQPPGRAVHWHTDGGGPWLEFMHYFAGSTRDNGCLRVLPGSHQRPGATLAAEAKALRDQQRVHDLPGLPTTHDDVVLPGEVSLAMPPDHLIVRWSHLYHATWVNRTPAGRYLSHWLFLPHQVANHRFTFRDYLTPEVLAALSPAQHALLWLDRQFTIDPRYQGERDRELGKVRWGTG
jgi:hypothetical protein